MAVFGNFAPGNLKTEKNDIAYHVGNFFSKILAGKRKKAPIQALI